MAPPTPPYQPRQARISFLPPRKRAARAERPTRARWPQNRQTSVDHQGRHHSPTEEQLRQPRDAYRAVGVNELTPPPRKPNYRCRLLTRSVMTTACVGSNYNAEPTFQLPFPLPPLASWGEYSRNNGRSSPPLGSATGERQSTAQSLVGNHRAQQHKRRHPFNEGSR